MTTDLCEVLPMPTYVLPAIHTDVERAEILRRLSYGNASTFAARVADHFPAVFDDVADWLGSLNAEPLSADDMQRLELCCASGTDDLARFMDWIRQNHPDVFDQAFKRIGRVEDLEAHGILPRGVLA